MTLTVAPGTDAMHSSADWFSKHPQLQVFVVFVGFGHSGHSLVGALLDCHPEAMIANEFNLLRRLQQGAEHSLVLDELIASAAENQAADAWLNTGYSYRVADSWQGRCTTLRVLGDKKGGQTAQILREHPALLDELERLAGPRLRLIGMARNPYDLIAAASARRERGVDAQLIDHVFANAALLDELLARYPSSQMHMLHQDQFLAEPISAMRELLEFVQLDPDSPEVRSGIEHLVKPQGDRRSRFAWTAEQLQHIAGARARLRAGSVFARYPAQP